MYPTHTTNVDKRAHPAINTIAVFIQLKTEHYRKNRAIIDRPKRYIERSFPKPYKLIC